MFGCCVRTASSATRNAGSGNRPTAAELAAAKSPDLLVRLRPRRAGALGGSRRLHTGDPLRKHGDKHVLDVFGAAVQRDRPHGIP